MGDDKHHRDSNQQVQRSHDAGRGQRYPLRTGTNQVNPSGTQRSFTLTQFRSVFLSI
jgi:hypothetical protein